LSLLAVYSDSLPRLDLESCHLLLPLILTRSPCRTHLQAVLRREPPVLHWLS
jgi:hypothetical protein